MTRRDVLAAAVLALCAMPALRAGGEPPYDPATLVDLEAVVSDVHESGDPPASRGFYLTMKTDTEEVEVYLAPASFIRSLGVTFQRGARLRVAGSRVKFAGAWMVVAREVRWGGSVLALRDRLGRPYWREFPNPKT